MTNTTVTTSTANLGGSEALQTEERSALAWAISDTLVLTRRNLLHLVRQPQLLVFTFIQPVMFTLLFRYVFGGAIQTGSVAYVNFLMPGIFVQTVVFGSTATGIGLAEDLATGVVDRFRSLPMSRLAVLAGRTLADLTRNTFVVALMTVIGLLVAIPAMFAYNFMVTKIRAFTQELDAFAIRFATQIEHTYVDARPIGEEISDAMTRALKHQDYHATTAVQASHI